MNGFHILQRRSGEREVMFNFSSFVEGGVETPVRRVSENQLPKNSCDLTTVLQRVFNVGGRVGAWVGFVGLSVDWMIELLVCLLIGFGKDTKLKEFVNNPTKKGNPQRNPTQQHTHAPPLLEQQQQQAEKWIGFHQHRHHQSQHQGECP